MMASITMSTMFRNVAIAKGTKYHFFLISCVRMYAKRKKYNYDLDHFIDWKNKTNLAFGSPLKLTKAGKIRKSKNNENEYLKATLEILSAQSTHLSRYRIDDESLDGLDDGHSSVTDTQSNNMPKDAYAQQSSASLCSDAQTTHQLLEEGDAFTQPSKTPYKKRMYAGDNPNEDEAHIPVISPIPSGNCDAPKSYNDIIRLKTTKSNEKHFHSKALPVEPPESFGFINSVPLSFHRRDAIERETSHQFLKFQEDVQSLSLRKVPSVKSILSKTMPDLNRFFLNRWREKMIAELGEEGFKVHQEATIKRGINFHANVMELLSGKSESQIQVMPDNEGHWVSLQTAMKDIGGIHALEEDMQHPALLYRGVADCVAKYKDVLCVIDWKTSKRPRPLLKNTYDDPLQVAAYIGLVSANRELLKIGEINHGLLVIIYPDGSPAHIHLMNKTVCEQYWQDWLGRLYYYYQLVYTDKCGASP